MDETDLSRFQYTRVVTGAFAGGRALRLGSRIAHDLHKTYFQSMRLLKHQRRYPSKERTTAYECSEDRTGFFLVTTYGQQLLHASISLNASVHQVSAGSIEALLVDYGMIKKN